MTAPSDMQIASLGYAIRAAYSAGAIAEATNGEKYTIVNGFTGEGPWTIWGRQGSPCKFRQYGPSSWPDVVHDLEEAVRAHAAYQLTQGIDGLDMLEHYRWKELLRCMERLGAVLP
jgi:hypothetical protein